MKHRAIGDLNQRNDTDLYQEISIGLEKIYEHCIELAESAKLLAENKQYRAFKIIQAISNEEAAKYLILLDVLRCPNKKNQDKTLFKNQLKKFNGHLAKGIYVKVYDCINISYEDICTFIKCQLEEFYYAGFDEGEDWKFKNEIISEREESFYVDYVQYEEGYNQWLSPKTPNVVNSDADSIDLLIQEAGLNINPHTPSKIIKLVKALHSIGISHIESIKVFSDFWRNFELRDEMRWNDIQKANHECLVIIHQKNLLGDKTTQDDWNLIINELTFPLHKIDMPELR